MTKSLLLPLSQHSNYPNHTMPSLFRRALLLASFLLFSLGGVWGEDIDFTITDDKFNITDLTSYDEESLVVFTFKAVQYVDNNNSLGVINNSSNNSGSAIDIRPDSGRQTGELFEISCSIKQLKEIGNSDGKGEVHIYLYWGATLENVVIRIPDTGGFINSNEASAQAYTGKSAPKDRDNDASGTLNFSEISIPNVTNLSEIIKYARIYVTDGSNTKLDCTETVEGMNNAPLLQVESSYLYPSEKISAQNGVAVYNNGASLDDFTITLNAGIGKLNQYKIVVLLSEGEITGSDDEAKEPEWNYKYTYTFTYPVNAVEFSETLESNDITEQGLLLRNILDNVIVNYFYPNVTDDLYNNAYTPLAKEWYAQWYVTDGSGLNNQPIQSSVNTVENKWTLTNDDNDNTSRWKESNNTIWSANDVDGTTSQAYFVRDYLAAGKTKISAPNGKILSDYPGYKIVFEVTNEYKGGAPNIIPEIKLRYVFEIPSSFTGELKGNGVGKTDGKPLTVESRESDSHSFNVGEDDDVNELVSRPVYARFYLVDTDGNIVDPTNGVLTVTYGNNSATDCPIPSQQGYYIYEENGINIEKISVTFAAPDKKFKFFKVVGVFSKDMEKAKYNEGELIREPDWDLQYTYSFTYNPTTKDYDEQQVEWKRNGIKPVASVGNIDTEWDTSWDELSLGYYVKWYIKNGDEIQPLAKGNGRQNDKWTINVNDFTVNTENEAVLTGTGTFNWNTWGKPTIYAPADKEFADVEDCIIYCEVYANSDITGKNPNARYTFSLYKSFLGELKDDDRDHKGSETIKDLDKNEATVTLNLGSALASYDPTMATNRAAQDLKYARVWLTTTDGTEIDPNGKLEITGMTPYSTEKDEYAKYGYYLSRDNIGETLKGLSATVTLPGVFSKHQVHVALSTDSPSKDNEGKIKSEPDYDYVYTYSFAYHVEIEAGENFTNQAKKDMVKGYGSKMVDRSDVSATFKLSDITFPSISDMSDIRYARIYVADASNGTPVNYATLLDVEEGQSAGSPTNGLFVYDGGNPLKLDNYIVTLNAGSDNMEKYKIMVLLSTDPISADGTETQEPKWDYEYTYKFTYGITEIYERLDDSVLDKQEVHITKNGEILSFFEKSADDFALSWYNQWYVVKDINNLGNKEKIQASEWRGGDHWTVTHYQDNEGDWPKSRWRDDDNVVWSDHSVGNGNEGWFINQVFAYYTHIHVPTDGNKKFGDNDYVDSKIILEVTDDNPYPNNDNNQWGNPQSKPSSIPDIKLRYIFEVPTPDTFPGQANNSNNGSGSKDIAKTESSASFTFSEASESTDASNFPNTFKYARIVLCDVKGNPLEDQSKLVVTYDGKPAVNAGRRLRNGVYVYNNGETLDKAKINVTLNGGYGNMAKYLIKCFLSPNAVPDSDMEGGRVIHEPNWDYEYEFWFNYIITTKEYTKTVEWKRNGMTPVASTDNLENDWETSWDELSMGINVVWYVVDANGDRQQLVAYNGSRINDRWAVDPTNYNVYDLEAILKERYTFASSFNSTIYTPSNKEKFEEVEDYKIICEIYTYSNVAYCTINEKQNEVPNARYTFTLYNGFLDDLKAGGKEEGTTIDVEHGTTTLELDLAEVQTKYKAVNPPLGTPKYVRVWLTTTDGTLVDPTDKLFVEGMTAYTTEGPTHVRFGYYLMENPINLNGKKIILTLDAGFYDQYQVHVAFSTVGLDPYPITEDSHESPYDYLYTFSFNYHVKKKYKTLICKEENGSWKVEPHLLQNWGELAVDCNATREELSSNLYLRWYLTDKDGNKSPITLEWRKYYDNGNEINHHNQYQKANGNEGYFRVSNPNNKLDLLSTLKDEDERYVPIITFSMPNGKTYQDMHLICVATTKTEGYTEDSWTKDPSDIRVMYIYTLKKVDDLKHFVHYQGESYRYRKELDNTYSPANNGYIKFGDNADQYIWDIAANDYDKNPVANNFRQNVHTVDYYYYIENTQNLTLPLQNFADEGEYGLKGNGTEPRAYFRWYDYETDQNAGDCLVPFIDNTTKDFGEVKDDQGRVIRDFKNYKVENALKNDEEWGLFALRLKQTWPANPNIPNNPSEASVGVTFDATKAFKDGKTEVIIACDVSRYLDGMDESFTYLVHEPTLSVRYLFHIRPASVIADEIVNKANANHETKEGLAAVEDKIMNRKPNQKISILENEGRIVMSTNDGFCTFSMRTQLTDLGHYYVYNNDAIKKAHQLQWYAYYQDENGVWWKRTVGKPITKIYAQYKLEENFSGQWTSLSGGSTKDITIGVGDLVQVVACVSSEGGAENMPIIWKELEFIDAKPLELGQETEERTVGHMNDEYTLANTLDFNEYSIYGFKKPTNSFENYSPLPLSFDHAQYGYCYPTLYGLCANDYLIYGWDGFGISPLHSDYTLLKSMNMPGISFDQTWDGQSIYCNWHDDDGKGQVYDVTHERAVGGKTVTETEDYGSFLYVDAADEARTIASLQFDAALCSEAKIYYTAYVASMTGSVQTPPMVRFRVTTENALGELVPVVTFVTGDIKDAVNHDGTFKQAQWYQVYGATTLPSELFELLDGSDRTYYVEIDNYCENTDGADYCIDQISFYTNNARLRVKQTGKNCGDEEGVILNVYVNADDLKETEMEGETIFWRICDTDGNPVTDESLYKIDDETEVGHDENGLPYGQIKVPNRPTDIPDEDDFDRSDATSGYFKGIDGTYYFSLAKKGFKLTEGADYYISVYKLGENAVKLESFWGHPGDVCSVFSPVFVPQAMYLSVEDGYDSDVSTVVVNCSTKKKIVNLNMVLNLPDKTAELGFRKYKGVRYDYFVGTEERLNNYPLEDGTTVNLLKAIFDFRDREIEDVQKYNTSYTSETFPATYQDEAEDENYYEAIKLALEKGELYLTCDPNFQLEISAGKSTIWAMPVDKYVKHDGINYGICSPLTFTFGVDATGGAPSLVLGFDDVDYTGKGIRVVRVGLEQLQKMQQEDGYLLHIPVNAFQTNDANYSTLEIIDDLELLKYSLDPDQTNDADVPNKDSEATASIYVAGLKGETVSNDKKYISVNFHQLSETSDNVETFTNFKEGFTYRMFFQVKVKVDGVEEADVCTGDVEFLLKVVPKYVTWNNGGSVEWNNDRNWTRSTREELHKGEKGATSNTDDYQNNEELQIPGNSAFVPMKFTYVTMPTGNVAPILTELKTVKDDGTDEGIYVNMGSSATKDIEYDLMVRYTEEKCVTDSHVGYGTGNIYDCEKFYSNWAKEIYFKPGAELINQQFLTYKKVWVEKELTAGKWTLMSTPLQNTYAGDMYVPVGGRQETEAFQPINFNTTTYSRTKYPIYQRSWGMNEGKVYTKKITDIRKTNYSALLKFNTFGETFAEWSHTYNDVEVDYSTWKGFAIRAHKKAQTDNKALIRLPKADESYDYYQWDNELPEENDKVTARNFNREKTGKLFTDKASDDNGVTHGIKYGTQKATTDGNVNEAVGEVQSAYDYQLVGNPYLCSINMETFLTVNADALAESGYWTYNDNKTTTNQTGVIGPMEAFFVKANENVTLQFTPAMMIDGNNLTTFMAAPALTMTANNGHGQSTATVSVGEEARSVETLFDSNLEDVPVVYTVADGQAVSIHQLTELNKPIAFGVTCAASDELVEVTFTDVAQLTSGDVYVVDAVTGEQTAVGEGSTLSLQPNDYGRYYLLAGTTDITDKVDMQKGILVSVRGREVTVTSSEELTQVHALSLTGATVYQDAARSTTTSFTLASGVYIIQAKNAAGEQQTVKVIIR